MTAKVRRLLGGREEAPSKEPSFRSEAAMPKPKSIQTPAARLRFLPVIRWEMEIITRSMWFVSKNNSDLRISSVV